jgi:transcriptional regulator with XRE-family HTH domain
MAVRTRSAVRYLRLFSAFRQIRAGGIVTETDQQWPDEHIDVRQQIGPALRALRERHRWSLRDLASKSGVSPAYLSRLERGFSVPSFMVLTSISDAFGVNVNYFIEFERTSRTIQRDLQHFLDEMGIPASTWPEFMGLSIEAQGSLVDGLRRALAPSAASLEGQQAAEMSVMANGVAESIPYLDQIVTDHGLSAVDFARQRTQLEEIAGDRFLILDRLCTLPATWLFDHLEVFRGMFGVEPHDPLLLKWWIRAQRSAFLKTVDGHQARAIYPIARVERYLHTGQWGTSLFFEPDIVRQHVEATIDTMREHPTYRIGLIDGDAPVRLIAKDGAGVLVMTSRDDPGQTGDAHGMALRFSGPQVTAQFREYFDELWERIPEERKDPEMVTAWLQTQLNAKADV